MLTWNDKNSLMQNNYNVITYQGPPNNVIYKDMVRYHSGRNGGYYENNTENVIGCLIGGVIGAVYGIGEYISDEYENTSEKRSEYIIDGVAITVFCTMAGTLIGYALSDVILPLTRFVILPVTGFVLIIGLPLSLGFNYVYTHNKKNKSLA